MEAGKRLVATARWRVRRYGLAASTGSRAAERAAGWTGEE